VIPFRPVLAAFGLILAAAGVAPAREDVPVVVVPEAARTALDETIRAAFARYDSVSAFPLPALDPEQTADLLDGGVVRFREKRVLSGEGEDERTRQRVLAFRLVGTPRVDAWIGALDPDLLIVDRVTEIRLGEGEDGATWYQFMDLPWPVKNRHWVIRIREAAEVAAATDGEVWESHWKLVHGGEASARTLAAAGGTAPKTLDDVRGARYLEENDGAWAFFALDEELTLVAYNLTIVLGGWIPEGLAARFAMRELESLLDRVAKAAVGARSHYVGDHPPIRGGDGIPLPLFPGPEADR